MKKRIQMIGLLTLTLLLRGAVQTVPKAVFDGSVMMGAHQRVHITIRDWRVDADETSPQTISIPVFSVMTLRSGRIETTLGTQTAMRQADDFWSGQAGSVMKVKVLSQSAIIRVIGVAE